MNVSKAKTFRNILYSSFGKALTLVCVALTSMVVARNLAPRDYGVVGFAGIIIGFLGQFSDMGLGNALIRLPEVQQRNLDTAFTLKLVLSVCAFIVAILVAPFAWHFLDHPAIGNVIRVLALTFLVSTIGFVPQVMLTREMNYRALVVPGVVGVAVQCALAVTLVLRGWSFWAIVIASLGATLTGGLVLQFTKRSPIHLGIDRNDAREYLEFGIPLFGTGVLVFVGFNLDNFLVGSSMGSIQLGYYALAFTWGSFICGVLSSTVNSVLLPAFSAIQHDAVAVRRWYLKTVDLVGFIAVVANTTLLANAPFFLVTFLGKGTGKWLPALLSLRVLCIYGIIRAVTEPLGPCLMARGRTRALLYVCILGGAVEVALLFLALRTRKIEMVACAVLIAYASSAIIYLPLLRREFLVSSMNIVAKIWPIFPALIIGWLATSLLPASFGNSFFTLGIRGFFTASVVAVTHGILSNFRCFHEVGGMISKNLTREVTVP